MLASHLVFKQNKDREQDMEGDSGRLSQAAETAPLALSRLVWTRISCTG